ncbi:MAG: PspC domain-containing protein [Bacteroidales bacterium]|nr:PspC domain-containing protein [Bacteroidales bacterium]
MKKIVSAGIGGRNFSMEEDAYAKLKSYLNEFRRRADMGNMTSEVMDDVEARISELFSSRIYTSKESVSLQMVEDVISQLGMPDGNSDNENQSEEPKKEKKMEGTKKFYRDPDTKAIGGVCSGLAAYFDIDVMIVRIIFIALLLAGTAGFWAYIILWLVAPLARTSAQKCELRGLPVTADNMAKFTSSK